ncbi:DUF6002 family protein [Streptosporangium sp. NPDC051022]|uniref:DUF6002 family protein n=1 Tax=Streptosporangium sp. NPDC051022 TaxID=3155752 RepID=UPI00342C5806
MTTDVLGSAKTVSVNVFAQHAERLRQAMAQMGRSRSRGAGFEPGFELPEATDGLAGFFGAADLRFADLGTAGRSRMVLLDLMGNPGTRTVKTLASHVIVARAARHTQVTGEPVMILTPSSANKATALRDAVLRAYRFGLADPGTLRIVTVVPDLARPKLWSSALDEDPALAVRNPMCVLGRGHRAHVKSLALGALEECEGELFARTGIRLWHTLDLANYQCADAVRAFAEREALPAEPGTTRAHAHAVSSAFGLLGHHFGTTLLPRSPGLPQYFLVQHLATPDMVLSLHDMTPPDYRFDAAAGLYRQDVEPRYPAATADIGENLEPTFYTRSPATSPAMNEIIRGQGGGGVVVSLYECLGRYDEVRALLAGAGVRLPADPRTLREWSLVMVMTGVLNAIDRGLLDVDEVVVHGSGSYSTDDFTPMPDRAIHEIGEVRDLRRVIFEAASATGTGEAAGTGEVV